MGLLGDLAGGALKIAGPLAGGAIGAKLGNPALGAAAGGMVGNAVGKHISKPRGPKAPPRMKPIQMKKPAMKDKIIRKARSLAVGRMAFSKAGKKINPMSVVRSLGKK